MWYRAVVSLTTLALADIETSSVADVPTLAGLVKEARGRLAWPLVETRSTAQVQTSHAQVVSYWAGQTGLRPVEALRRALWLAGKDPGAITIDDQTFLAAVDEFHCLGVEATDDLARLVGLAPGAHVLDIGCGLGGPSRRLATQYRCAVTGLDLTRGFLDIASGLTDAMGLSHKIRYVHGDATDRRFDDRLFDVAWMQVTAANIAERVSLYRNIYRLLKPEGTLAIFDVFQEPSSPLMYPVPWSDDGATSAVCSESETVAFAEMSGFRCILRRDVSTQALGWFQEQYDRTVTPGVVPAFGIIALLPRWLEICRSQVFNLKRGAIRFGYLIFKKI